ncbi:MAG: rod shape-determining protein MreC [Anaerolineales bacterium]|nr:rod shape-determining protein MreC [Anaerolineales bacterium]
MSNSKRRLLIASALFAAAIGLVLLGQAGMLAPVQDLAQRAVTGVQRSISTAFFTLRDFLTAPRNLQELIQTNSQLEERVAQLEAEVVTLRDQAAEVDQLKALLGAAREAPENRYLAAQVIGRDTSPFLHYLILDQGSIAGVRRGMPVVNEKGLVGRITEVSASASKLQLITDPDSVINARIQESRAEGILVGRATGELEMIYVSQDIKVTVGEIVVTSGLGGGFPPEILIGRVVSVHRRDYELYQTAIIEPRSDFSRLEMVLIITNFEPVLIDPLLERAR